jgi:hypothetical protein
MHSFACVPAAALAAAAWMLAVPAAYAETQSDVPQSSERVPSAAAPSAADISEQKLDAAVAALANTARVKQDYERRIDAAEPSEKKRIADEANSALVKAVTDQGLSVAEYTSILMVAQNDASVRERILRRMTPDK